MFLMSEVPLYPHCGTPGRSFAAITTLKPFLTGLPRSQENALPLDPTVGRWLKTYGGLRGGCIFL